MSFIDKGTLWGVKKESTYGNVETVNFATDRVEFVNPTMDGSIEQINREVTKPSLVEAESLVGKETSSGTLPIEVTSTEAGLLNGDVLYESAMGVRIAPVANIVLGTPDTSIGATIDVPLGSAFQVCQGLKVKVDGSYQYVTVTGISGNTLTVSPELTGTEATEVEGLLSYRLAKPTTPITSFNVEEYLENDSSYIAYKYLGCVVNSFSLEFPLANVVKASFAVEGAGFSAVTTTKKASGCLDLAPHIAKNIVFIYDDVSYDINELTVKLDNSIYNSETLTSSGINKKLITGKTNLGGTFKVDYDGLSLFNKYKAKSSGELVFSTTTVDGKKFGGYAPKVSLKNVSKSTDNSVYKDDVELQFLSSGACTAGVEDAFSIWFE